MNRLPRITEIIKVEPFKVVVRWTTGEIKVIDFEELVKVWHVDPDDPEAGLLDFDVFKFVSVSEQKTLQWVNIPVSHMAFEGDQAVQRSSPLMFDPDVLYEASHGIEEFRLVPVQG